MQLDCDVVHYGTIKIHNQKRLIVPARLYRLTYKLNKLCDPLSSKEYLVVMLLHRIYENKWLHLCQNKLHARYETRSVLKLTMAWIVSKTFLDASCYTYNFEVIQMRGKITFQQKKNTLILLPWADGITDMKICSDIAYLLRNQWKHICPFWSCQRDLCSHSVVIRPQKEIPSTSDSKFQVLQFCSEPIPILGTDAVFSVLLAFMHYGISSLN